jgi:hypothetical protein
MRQPFLIVALPRSRTCWLSKFLTYDGQVCHHEPSLRWSEPGDLAKFLARGEGASDTMMTWLAHDARKICPKLPIVVVRRNRASVLESIRKLPYASGNHLPWYHALMDRRLDQIEDELNPLTVGYDDLNRREVCDRIFRHCLDIALPMSWWKRWKDVNVQADIAETVRLLKANKSGADRIYGARHREIA